MLSLTKIFHFEMAHAIYGYPGACKNIHGHSYELHVTVSSYDQETKFLPSPGFIIDFKEIKHAVQSAVIGSFDHKLILSKEYLNKYPAFLTQENLVIWEVEPTAENMLLYFKDAIDKKLAGKIKLARLKLYETKESYAEWFDVTNFKYK